MVNLVQSSYPQSYSAETVGALLGWGRSACEEYARYMVLYHSDEIDPEAFRIIFAGGSNDPALEEQCWLDLHTQLDQDAATRGESKATLVRQFKQERDQAWDTGKEAKIAGIRYDVRSPRLGALGQVIVGGAIAGAIVGTLALLGFGDRR